MHRLQQHIMQQLILNPDMRYARLKPVDVEGNLFMYHLGKVIDAGWVHKRADGLYELTADGKLYADRLSLKTLTPRAQPRIVTLMAITNPAGEWLLYRRQRQPLMGMVGFPYGKVHLGETIEQAAARELKEKTGLAAELVHRGDGYATIHQGGQPVSQIFFHLFRGHDPQGKLHSPGRVGQAFWGDPAEVVSGELMPTVPDLIARLQSHPRERFFAELVYN